MAKKLHRRFWLSASFCVIGTVLIAGIVARANSRPRPEHRAGQTKEEVGEKLEAARQKFETAEKKLDAEKKGFYGIREEAPAPTPDTPGDRPSVPLRNRVVEVSRLEKERTALLEDFWEKCDVAQKAGLKEAVKEAGCK